MKTYPLLIVALLIYSSFYAQTENCISNEVQGEDPSSCCNDLISTAPINPVNTEYPALLNQFDWLAPTSELPSPNILAVNIGGSLVYRDHPLLVDNTRYYWFSSFRSGQTAPFDSHSMHPRFGWELMHMNLGLGLFGDDTGQSGGRYNPYLIFYNKYSGKMRLLTYPGFAISSLNNINVNLSIQSTIDLQPVTSGLLNRYNQKQLALDKPSPVNSVSSFLSVAAPWSIADFQLAYDPCTCNLPSRIQFEFMERDYYRLTMDGRLAGKGVPLNPAGRNPLQFHDDFLSSFLIDDFFGRHSGKAAMLVYNQIDQDASSAYISEEMKFYASALDLVETESNDIEINVPGISFRTPAGAIAAAGAGFASKQINHPASQVTYLEKDIAINGVLLDETNTTSFAGFELRSPGTFISDHSLIPWTQHAFYNELPGHFALLKTPNLLFGYDKNNLFGLVVDEPLQYALNPAAEIDLEQTEIYAAIEFDVYSPLHENFEYYEHVQSLLTPTFNIADIQYVPNTDILEKFPFLGSSTFEHNKLAAADRYTTADSCSKITIQTALIPIDKLDKLRFMEKYDQQYLALNHPNELGISQENHLKLFDFRVKILANYTFLPNAYGETNKTVQVYTYELGEITKSDYLDFEDCYNIPDEFCDVEGDYNQYGYEESITFPNTHFTESIDIYGGTITIEGNLTTAEGVEVNLYASEEIIISDSSNETPSISPNINLTVRDMYPYEGTNTISQSDLKAFCNGSEYKASSLKLTPLQSELDKKDSTNIEQTVFEYKLYPNPANDILNFDLKLTCDANISVRVLDTSGRELRAFRINEQWDAGEYLSQLQTIDLPAGLLFFEICVDGNCMMEKLSVIH